MLNRAEQRGVVANGSLFILPGYHPSTASLGCNYSDGYYERTPAANGYMPEQHNSLRLHNSAPATPRAGADVVAVAVEAPSEDVLQPAGFVSGRQRRIRVLEAGQI